MTKLVVRPLEAAPQLYTPFLLSGLGTVGGRLAEAAGSEDTVSAAVRPSPGLCTGGRVVWEAWRREIISTTDI